MSSRVPWSLLVHPNGDRQKLIVNRNKDTQIIELFLYFLARVCYSLQVLNARFFRSSVQTEAYTRISSENGHKMRIHECP